MSRRSSRIPERQCIACGARRPQPMLVRLRVERLHAYENDGNASEVLLVKVDGPHDRRVGRGAYLCPRWSCLERALKKRAFNRAFRTTVRVNEDELRSAFAARIEEGRYDSGR